MHDKLDLRATLLFSPHVHPRAHLTLLFSHIRAAAIHYSN